MEKRLDKVEQTITRSERVGIQIMHCINKPLC